jgi:hypothetical protein
MSLRRIALQLTASVAVSVVGVLGAVPLSADATTTPSVQAQPSTGIADGQVITVTGSGFTAGATIAVMECQTGTTSESGCDLSTYILTTASNSGAFSTPFIASRYLHLSGPTTVDCAVPGACFLAAANLNNFAEAASTPITFDPTAPAPPPLQLGGSLSPSGTVDQKTGVASLSGTVTCNRPAYATVSGELSQIYHRFVFSSYFSGSVLCTSTTNWALSVQPTNGLFGQGATSVTATVSRSVGGIYSQVDVSGPVTLKFPKK